jgi:elongation factor Tu
VQKIEELLNTMDEVIPVSGRPIDKPFLMSVEGTYNIGGRGVVASGTVEQGRIKIGDEIEFFGYGSKMKSVVTGIETFNKTLDYGEAGDNVGILIRGVEKKHIHRGLIIAKPGSLTTAQVISANIYCLTEEEGGRKNSFTSGYRPQVHIN